MEKKTSEDERRCQYFIKKKGRSCRMLTKPGNSYCGEHMVTELPSVRIPCPLDPRHTVYSSSVRRHIAVCNARLLAEQPWYRYNVNVLGKVEDNDGKGKLVRERVAAEHVRLLLNFFAHFGESVVSETRSCDEMNELSRLNFNDTGRRSVIERTQLSSILGHLKECGAFADDDDAETCFLEFGAGRGRLTYWISMLKPSSIRRRYVLIEKSGVRYKYENKAIKDHLDKVQFTRIHSPIEHLVLGDVPPVRTATSVVATCKHLCGDAFDAALCCLVNAISSAHDYVKLRTVLMAPCCLHRCRWSKFCGQEAFRSAGLNEDHFRTFCTMASWSNSGLGESRRALVKCSSCIRNGNSSACRECGYVDIIDVSRKAKVAINLARKKFLEKVGLSVRLVQFVPDTVTPENLLLIAKKCA